MSKQSTSTATPTQAQPSQSDDRRQGPDDRREGPRDRRLAPTVTHTIVNGNLLEGEGEKFKHRLCMSEDCDWYIEFKEGDGRWKKLPAGSGKPTHSVELDLGAEIFRGKFSNAETFLTFGVDKPRGRGDDNGTVFDDWYTDPTSRGMGC